MQTRWHYRTCLRRLDTSATLLVLLEALSSGLLDGCLASNDSLDLLEDIRPVLEDGEWDVLASTVADEIYSRSQRLLKGSLNMSTYRDPSSRTRGRSPAQQTDLIHRHRRRTWSAAFLRGGLRMVAGTMTCHGRSRYRGVSSISQHVFGFNHTCHRGT